MGFKVELNDLKRELDELRNQHPKFKSDDLFVMWFLRAYLTDDIPTIASSISGGSNDKGADAVLIDHTSRTVFIIQGKFRETVYVKNEPRSDVISFSQLGTEIITDDNHQFRNFISDTEPYVATLLKKARTAVHKNHYRLRLYYVTLGKCSGTIKKDARSELKTRKYDADLHVIDGKQVMTLLRDYLDGVAPPIPTLDLEMESGRSVTVNGILQRYDNTNEIESWVFSMRGDKIGELYNSSGVRLFARNIRGFLGDTPVNHAMMTTLKDDAKRFYYYNNGITIICDEAEKISRKGRDILRVSNPQIINGQQTTRTLASHIEESYYASIIVKVIQVPRDNSKDETQFDSLVSQIVAGTNWQNAIKASDLMTNDRRQIEIEREFRKLGYLYERRRQAKREAKSLSTGKQFFTVKKEDLAQAVAGCDLDPVVPRSGKDNLFKEEFYTQVFPNSDPNFYLPRFWLKRLVTREAKGYPERGYAKWLVLGFVWKNIRSHITNKKNARIFREACESRDNEILDPLSKMINKTYVAALRYYRKNRGKGDRAADVSTFFRGKQGRDKEFLLYWSSKENKSRTGFNANMKKLERSISEYEY